MALTAIQQILGGAKPEELESQTLGFREESGTVEEAACFANSASGGVLVVGIDG